MRDRVKAFVERGQLGPFANAYWGHPAYKLPPEANLLAVAHYLEALDWQREFIRIHAILGGKNPHLQSFLVGGMATPVDPDKQASLNMGTIAQLQGAHRRRPRLRQPRLHPRRAGGRVVLQGLGVDRRRRRQLHRLRRVSGRRRPDSGAVPPGGVICGQGPEQGRGRSIRRRSPSTSRTPGTSTAAATTRACTRQSARPARSTPGPKPPYERLDTNAKYSWLKSPRYDGEPMEVGPLARMLVAYGRGQPRGEGAGRHVLGKLGVGPEALFSTLGRIAARAIETLVLVEKMDRWVDGLADNMARRDLRIHDNDKWDPSTWPKDCFGAGFHEAPRGALGHWVHISDGAIANYQCVVPSTWNAGPRDAEGKRGPYEAALLGTPVANPEQPLEILRTVHSFDPCMACGVHVVDAIEARAGPSEGDVSAMARQLPARKVILERVYVWELPVRADALADVLFDPRAVGNGLLYRPSLHQRSGRGERHFVMGTVRAVHFYAAIVFTLAVLARIYWLFVGNGLCAPDASSSRCRAAALAQPVADVLVLFLHPARSRRLRRP